MEFELIHIAPLRVRQLRAYTTRRTSIAIFYESTTALYEFVEYVLQVMIENLHVHFQRVMIPRDELHGFIQTSRFAFDRIHQRVRARRFPANLAQLWAYLGLPIRSVAADLAVSVPVLRRRCAELHRTWPRHSDPDRILVAVQYTDQNEDRVMERVIF